VEETKRGRLDLKGMNKLEIETKEKEGERERERKENRQPLKKES